MIVITPKYDIFVKMNEIMLSISIEKNHSYSGSAFTRRTLNTSSIARGTTSMAIVSRMW